jgi:hypothetical protein
MHVVDVWTSEFRWVLRIATLIIVGQGCGERSPGAADLVLTRTGTVRGVVQLDASAEMRIDGYEADLVAISWLGVTPDATVAVFQSQDHLVRYFDHAGLFIGSFGGDGAGPGEFQNLPRGGWKADTLWVSDPQLRRITLISPVRTLVRTLPLLFTARPLAADSTTLPDFPFVSPYALYPGDSLLVSADPERSDPRADKVDGSALLTISADGWIGRLIAVIPSAGSIEVALPGGGVAGGRIPFFPRPLWAVSPDGGVVATVVTKLGDQGGAITVTLTSQHSGATVRKDIPFEGVPIPAQVVDSLLAGAARVPIPELRRAYEASVRDLAQSMYPPVEELVIGNDHRLWLGLRATGAWRSWLVIDEEGNAVALVSLPATGSVEAALGDAVWVVEPDDNDVQSIVRYRLRSRG